MTPCQNPPRAGVLLSIRNSTPSTPRRNSCTETSRGTRRTPASYHRRTSGSLARRYSHSTARQGLLRRPRSYNRRRKGGVRAPSTAPYPGGTRKKDPRVSRGFAKPSPGLEPRTPSLPCVRRSSRAYLASPGFRLVEPLSRCGSVRRPPVFARLSVPRSFHGHGSSSPVVGRGGGRGSPPPASRSFSPRRYRRGVFRSRARVAPSARGRGRRSRPVPRPSSRSSGACR